MVGYITHTFFNTGERLIDLRPGESKGSNMVCRMGVDAKGDVRVEVARVFENPNQDGKTLGKVVEKDIVFTLTTSKR